MSVNFINIQPTCLPDPVALSDVRLFTREYGDAQSGAAPVVLMLHGFPDLSLSWQYHAERLAEKGYFVVTPDLRGFGSSPIPEESQKLASYSRERLVSDIYGLRKRYCGEDGSFAMLVGHDWGGVVVWATLEALGRASSGGDTQVPIAKSAVLVNAPHPHVFSKYIYTPKQALKSWYIFCFQLKWWPEFFLEHTKSLYYLNTKKEYLLLVQSLQESGRNSESSCSADETDTESSTCSAKWALQPMDVEQNLAIFKEALTDRARIHAMLSYYRAMSAGFWSQIRDPLELSLANRVVRWLHNRHDGQEVMEPSTSKATSTPQSNKSIVVPTLILWGKNDRFLGEELASPPDGLLEHFYGTKFFDAGHWVHWEKPQEIAEELIHFANAHNE